MRNWPRVSDDACLQLLSSGSWLIELLPNKMQCFLFSSSQLTQILKKKSKKFFKLFRMYPPHKLISSNVSSYLHQSLRVWINFSLSLTTVELKKFPARNSCWAFAIVRYLVIRDQITPYIILKEIKSWLHYVIQGCRVFV